MRGTGMVGALTHLAYQTFANSGGDRLVWAINPHRLRILSYHGVCDDYLGREAWMPRYFVTKSAFENQLQYLERHARVLPLGEAIDRLKNGTLPPRSVSITFDDGYANNLQLAYPLLHKYRMSATVFVSSDYTSTGELYPFLKLRFIRLHARHFPRELLVPVYADYKSLPVDCLIQSIAPCWAAIKKMLTRDQYRTLRPLTPDEIRSACSFFEFGAHTHTHCILENETTSRRREEIGTSIATVSKWTRRRVLFFSYPNGQVGDFGEVDKQMLRAEGIEAAVTGIAGANRTGSELLALKRYPVGIDHDRASFSAEVTGFRTAVRSVAEKLPS